MKTIYKGLIILSVSLIMVASFNACRGSSSKVKPAESTEVAKVQYTCPMHPEVVSDKPGNCPKCGMTLVEKK